MMTWQEAAIAAFVNAGPLRVEQILGGQLQWEDLEGKRACRIGYGTPGTPTDNNTDELIDWLQEHHLKFREAFWPVVKQLPSELWA
jgi:hypothetical protein